MIFDRFLISIFKRFLAVRQSKNNLNHFNSVNGSQTWQTLQGELGFLQAVFVWVDEIVVGRAEISFFQIGFQEDGTRHVAILEDGFFQVALSEISLNDAAFVEMRTLHVQTLKRGVLQVAIAESHAESELVGNRKIRSHQLAALKSDLVPRCARHFAQTEIAGNETAGLEIHFAKDDFREITVLKRAVKIFFVEFYDSEI